MKNPVHNIVSQSLSSADAQLEQTVLGWGQGTQSTVQLTETVLLQLLVGGMLRTRTIHLKPFVYTPFMVDTEAGQPGNGVSLLQLF